MDRDADLSANNALKEAARRRAVPVELIAVAPVCSWCGDRATIKEIGHCAGEGGVNDGVDLAPFIQPALGESTDASALAWGEAVADRDLSRHNAIVADEKKSLLADPTGFEPAISSVTGWHVGPLHHGSATGLRSLPEGVGSDYGIRS
jgi:hypothetical protein